ncbi:pentapeptide repeat-containing protein [Parasphingorhabdus sp.]|uniref:pentapeptide repeat-containing protein n=1 Tax=Parasphingorhabdus sp. TaxID=2709688 RepID=UPI003263D984
MIGVGKAKGQALRTIILAIVAFALLSSAPIRATPPPLTCNDLVIAAERDGQDIAGRRGVKLANIKGEELNTPEELRETVNRPGIEATIITGGQFKSWDFSGYRLRPTCFVDADLSESNWAGATIQAPAFVRTNLRNSDFSHADISHVRFHNADLTGANMRDAQLGRGKFTGGWFEGGIAGWIVDRANLQGFIFDCGITVPDGCPVYQGGDPMSARGTDFSGATLHSFGLFSIDVEGAIFDETIVDPDQLPDLRGANFQGDLVLRGGAAYVSVSPAEASALLEASSDQQVIASNPSFDCSDARSKVEEEICGEYADGLRQLDRDVATLYKRAKAMEAKVRKSQLAWLKQRNKCNAEEYAIDCIRSSYSERKGRLLGMLGETNWLRKGQDALFTDEVLALPGDYRDSDLYRKIAPVLAGSSMTQILVQRDDDGLNSIAGSAVGANAHLCNLRAEKLYLDTDTGWYVPVSEGPVIPIFRIMDGRLEVYKNGRPDYEKDSGVLDFMSCGMRASFPATLRIAADDATMEQVRKSFAEQM